MHSTVIIVESMSATSSFFARAVGRLDDDVDRRRTRPSSAAARRVRRRGRTRRSARRALVDPVASARRAAGRRAARSARVETSPARQRRAAISVAMNMRIPDLPKVALIAGPTASGKSALALALAETHGGVVINADCAQVYADLRIAHRAARRAEEEARAPHRLFGHVDGADTGYSAARWAAEARAAIDAAHRGGQAADPGRRHRALSAHAARRHRAGARDRSGDPRRGARACPSPRPMPRSPRPIPTQPPGSTPTDTTRVARALEVVRSTGRPLAEWQARARRRDRRADRPRAR